MHLNWPWQGQTRSETTCQSIRARLNEPTMKFYDEQMKPLSSDQNALASATRLEIQFRTSFVASARSTWLVLLSPSPSTVCLFMGTLQKIGNSCRSTLSWIVRPTSGTEWAGRTVMEVEKREQVRIFKSFLDAHWILFTSRITAKRIELIELNWRQNDYSSCTEIHAWMRVSARSQECQRSRIIYDPTGS